MPITVTDQEKAELAAAGTLVRPLAGADGAVSTVFHNPKTGQEFVNLPIDPYHLGRHLRRGLVMGPASPELREKWEAGEAERQAANDALMAEHLGKSPVEETPRFSDAVAAAVTQVLEKLGVEIPSEKQEAWEEGKEGAEELAPIQLELPFGETSESETKHVVSQSPRPNASSVE
ncbi:hypothetical protein LCGC14_2890660 [marine sediment metagenome]|uniref:Uncharacterized protein n=1 Tax=marine sediment metagenome TaxID=412755 RepID=A0A0F9ANF5_9ZZZZ